MSLFSVSAIGSVVSFVAEKNTIYDPDDEVNDYVCRIHLPLVYIPLKTP